VSLLEGAQAGLSWNTILKKRENYRQAFDRFDPEKIASYDRQKVQELLQDRGIIRNKLKIEATIINAQKFLQVRQEFNSFDAFIWKFVDGETMQNRWKNSIQVPLSTKQSESMSKELKRKGFKFVGSTICYAFMQAVGMVNDHTIDCFRHQELLGDR
jgi:DNA-3-methyladenine glycosylase I